MPWKAHPAARRVRSPQLTKWPSLTSKSTYREHDGLIVALDQAFEDLLAGSMDYGR